MSPHNTATPHDTAKAGAFPVRLAPPSRIDADSCDGQEEDDRDYHEMDAEQAEDVRRDEGR